MGKTFGVGEPWLNSCATKVCGDNDDEKRKHLNVERLTVNGERLMVNVERKDRCAVR